MTSKPVYDADVIIAGAGISALSAAYQLSQHGRKVLLLESRDRIGGRIHSIPVGNAQMDLGASFVHGLTDNPLTELSKTVPFELHLPKSDTPVVAYPPNAHGKHEDPEKSTKMEYLSHCVTFERLHDIAQRGQDGTPRDDESIWSGLNKFKAGQGVWKGVSEEEREELLKMSLLWNGWTGASLDQVSLKWWGWEREFRGPDAVVQPGYSTLIDWLHEQSKLHTEVMLQHKVETVELVNDGDSVRVSAVDASSGKVTTYTAPYFICSLPLGVMQKSPPAFSPPLPPRRTEAIKSLGNGLLNKVILVYPHSWWNTNSTDPKEWIMLQDDPKHYIPPSSSRDMTPTDALNHLSYGRLFGQDYTHINGLSAILFYVGPPLGETIEQLDDNEIAELLHTRLVETLLQANATPSPPQPQHTHVTRWRSDPHALGSYSYFPNASTGGPMEMLELARPLWNERLGFCGEHTEENHFASVHGPYITGIREARRVESFLREAEES